VAKGECFAGVELPARTVVQEHFYNVEADFHRRLFQQPQVIERSSREEAAFVSGYGGGRSGQCSDERV